MINLKKSSGETGEFSGGSGTVEAPYLISTEAQLGGVASKTKLTVTGDNTSDLNRREPLSESYRLLLCDIELSNGFFGTA